MQKKYLVRLTDAEREMLNRLVKTRRVSAQKVRRAQILLKADADGPNWADVEIAKAFDCQHPDPGVSARTTRDRGIRDRAQRPTEESRSREGSRRGAGGQDHRVAAGRAAERICELVVTAPGRTSRGTGNRGVGQPRNPTSDSEKNGMTRRKIEYWVIPPEADAEFAASMEEVLDAYARPYDSRYPVLCMDEQPMQLLKETRTPIQGIKNHPRRVDYEYERAGTVSIFMFCEPLSGWRQVSVRDRRTKVDWAQEVETLLRTRYASAEKVTLVSDNLNTHTKGAFYETFEPQIARLLVRRLEFCHTPKRGSRLNIAENELSSMIRQCITGRRFATADEVREETAPWYYHSNARQRSVDWQFKVDDARLKLKSVYPKLEV